MLNNPDTVSASLRARSLTTIQVPTAATWQRAGEYLVRHLAGEQTIMHHEVDYSLIVHESTAPTARSPK